MKLLLCSYTSTEIGMLFREFYNVSKVNLFLIFQDYDHDHASVTDKKNKAFLKFLRSVDHEEKPDTSADIDPSVQPGGDLHSYLRDLKSSAR